MALEWHATAPGLLYEAYGDNHRRYVVAHDGKTWFLDLPYATEQQTDPQQAPTLEAAQQMAQDWESELY